MKRPRRLLKIILIVLGVLGFIMALGFEQNRIVTERYEISLDRLPEGFDGFAVAVVSDLHAKVFKPDNDPLVNAVSDARPDLIAVTGDLCAYPDEIGDMAALCARLMEIAPVCYVTGNHEWARQTANLLIPRLRDVGVTVLQNAYVPLTKGPDTVVLLGLEDPNGPADTRSVTDTVAALRGEYGDAFILALSHRNTLIKKYADHRLDLVLSGHGHGGIVRLPFVGGVFGTNLTLFPGYTAGLYREGDTVMLVSRGLGNVGPERRFFNPPHLPIAVLRRAEN